MPKTIGVIVGRFQAPQLTPGHVHLINTALLQNERVLLLVGSSPRMNEPDVALPFTWRSSMIQSDPRIQSAGKHLYITEIKDIGDDNIWMTEVQTIIKQYSGVGDLIRLYGSRDSSFLSAFAAAADGEIKYEIVELLPLDKFSASERREQIATQYPTGRDTDDKIREG